MSHGVTFFSLSWEWALVWTLSVCPPLCEPRCFWIWWMSQTYFRFVGWVGHIPPATKSLRLSVYKYLPSESSSLQLGKRTIEPGIETVWSSTSSSIYINSADGLSLTWSIYEDGILIDSSTERFSPWVKAARAATTVRCFAAVQQKCSLASWPGPQRHNSQGNL